MQSADRPSDIRKGFVYRRVPHVTLKAIANNEQIDTIHARWQENLDPLRDQLNQLLKQSWQEWEVPRDLTADDPDDNLRKSLKSADLKKATGRPRTVVDPPL